MNAKKIIASEGDLVAVPIKGEGYVIGLIAYTNKETMLGYFFNKIYPDIPSKVDPSDLDKKKVILIARFSSLGIESGEWPLLKNSIKFKKNDWTIPAFKIQDPLTNKYFAMIYKEDLLNSSRHHIAEGEAKKLYGHGLFGYVALENKLNSLLKPKSS